MSPEVNRFVLDEFKANDVQTVAQLTTKLFETTRASARDRGSIHRRIGRIKCKKQVLNSLSMMFNIGLIDRDEEELNKYTFTDLGKDIFKEHEVTTDDRDKLLQWTYEVGDKQYFLYSWNDTKVAGLLTVDSILMAGILFILQLLDNKINMMLSLTALALYAISFSLLALSIIFCLIHTIPKLNSKMGHGHNLKTMIGINRFAVIQKMLGGKKFFNAEQSYFNSVKGLSADDLLELNIYQILGMNTNNIRSHEIIRKGVQVTIISVITMILATIIFAIQNIVIIASAVP